MKMLKEHPYRGPTSPPIQVASPAQAKDKRENLKRKKVSAEKLNPLFFGFDSKRYKPKKEKRETLRELCTEREAFLLSHLLPESSAQPGPDRDFPIMKQSILYLRQSGPDFPFLQ